MLGHLSGNVQVTHDDRRVVCIRVHGHHGVNGAKLLVQRLLASIFFDVLCVRVKDVDRHGAATGVNTNVYDALVRETVSSSTSVEHNTVMVNERMPAQ